MCTKIQPLCFQLFKLSTVCYYSHGGRGYRVLRKEGCFFPRWYHVFRAVWEAAIACTSLSGIFVGRFQIVILFLFSSSTKRFDPLDILNFCFLT